MYNIRIKSLPSGLKTGDQYNYALVDRNTLFIKEDTSKKDDIKDTISAVPREEATLEAEGGEVIVGDINQDGFLEHQTVTGNRHSQGGVPLNIPSDPKNPPFIFSDTKSLKIKDPEVLKIFGMGGKVGGYTPATIAKKYKINSYVDTIKDPKSDKIARDTAQAMSDNNLKKLGLLALVQESMKGFPDGVPAIAESAMAGLQGGAPQGEGQEQMARYGGNVYQKGGEGSLWGDIKRSASATMENVKKKGLAGHLEEWWNDDTIAKEIARRKAAEPKPKPKVAVKPSAANNYGITDSDKPVSTVMFKNENVMRSVYPGNIMKDVHYGKEGKGKVTYRKAESDDVINQGEDFRGNKTYKWKDQYRRTYFTNDRVADVDAKGNILQKGKYTGDPDNPKITWDPSKEEQERRAKAAETAAEAKRKADKAKETKFASSKDTFFINNKPNQVAERYKGFWGDEWVKFKRPIEVYDEDNNKDVVTEMTLEDYEKLKNNKKLDVGYQDNIIQPNKYTDLSKLSEWDQDRSIFDNYRGAGYNTLTYSNKPVTTKSADDRSDQLGRTFKKGNKTYEVVGTEGFMDPTKGNEKVFNVKQISDPDKNIGSYFDTMGGYTTIPVTEYNKLVGQTTPTTPTAEAAPAGETYNYYKDEKPAEAPVEEVPAAPVEAPISEVKTPTLPPPPKKNLAKPGPAKGTGKYVPGQEYNLDEIEGEEYQQGGQYQTGGQQSVAPKLKPEDFKIKKLPSGETVLFKKTESGKYTPVFNIYSGTRATPTGKNESWQGDANTLRTYLNTMLESGVNLDDIKSGADFQSKLYDYTLETNPESIYNMWGTYGQTLQGNADPQLKAKLEKLGVKVNQSKDAYTIDMNALSPEQKVEAAKVLKQGYVDNKIGTRTLGIQPGKPKIPPIIIPPPVKEEPPITVQDIIPQQRITRRGPWYTPNVNDLLLAGMQRIPDLGPAMANYNLQTPGYVLEDPTRQLAASQEAQARYAEGLYGSTAGNVAGATAAANIGQGIASNADIIAGVENRNVGTVNQAYANAAGIQNQAEQLNEQAKQQYLAQDVIRTQGLANAYNTRDARVVGAFNKGWDNRFKTNILEKMFPQVAVDTVYGDIGWSGVGRDPSLPDVYVNPMTAATSTKSGKNAALPTEFDPDEMNLYAGNLYEQTYKSVLGKMGKEGAADYAKKFTMATMNKYMNTPQQSQPKNGYQAAYGAFNDLDFT